MRAALGAWPPPLLRRWVLTIAAGVGFLLVGVAVWLAAGDQIMLILSGTAFLLVLVRAVLLACTLVLLPLFLPVNARSLT